MGDKTGIAWTQATWNPTIGCNQVSPGCEHCYAKTLVDTRMSKMTTGPYAGMKFEDLKMLPERLDQPLRWRRPRLIFTNSMSDLFHVDVNDTFLGAVFAIMAEADWHTFQVLTKRAERMPRFVKGWHADNDGWPNPLPNVWLGVSIESNAYAWRAGWLRQTPAAVRWLSLEPLLGPVDKVSFEGIDWVVIGGESGRGHRAMDPGWLRDAIARCYALGIPVFVKQDSGMRSGLQGRIPDDLWRFKEYPRVAPAAPSRSLLAPA